MLFLLLHNIAVVDELKYTRKAYEIADPNIGNRLDKIQKSIQYFTLSDQLPTYINTNEGNYNSI